MKTRFSFRVNFPLIAVLLLAFNPANAQMYKCATGSGNVYQEKPCSKGGEKVDVTAAPVSDKENRFNNDIAIGQVRTGMTSAQVIRAWGKPTKINRTAGAGYSSEQWIYENGRIGNSQYLYLDNGVLRSIQSSVEK